MNTKTYNIIQYGAFAISMLLTAAAGLSACQTIQESGSRGSIVLVAKKLNLCDQKLAECPPCGGPGQIACDPQGLSGWLCCEEDGGPPCSESSDMTCDNIFWCDLYTKEPDANGVEHIVCWDEFGQGLVQENEKEIGQ